MSGEDFKDYLNQQAQAEQVERRLNDMLGDPERQAADLERVVQRGAEEEISQIAEQAESISDGFLAVVGEARDLRTQIAAGGISLDDARQQLISLRNRHGRLTEDTGSLQPWYETAKASAKDPAARRDQLINKYPGLRR